MATRDFKKSHYPSIPSSLRKSWYETLSFWQTVQNVKNWTGCLFTLRYQTKSFTEENRCFLLIVYLPLKGKLFSWKKKPKCHGTVEYFLNMNWVLLHFVCIVLVISGRRKPKLGFVKRHAKKFLTISLLTFRHGKSAFFFSFVSNISMYYRYSTYMALLNNEMSWLNSSEIIFSLIL